jgi:hypothetical protein
MIEQWSREPAPKLRKTLPGAFALLVVAVCLACTGDTAWFAAIAISAAGLCALARWGSMLSGDARCVLADALLLTPLLFR